MKTMRTALGSLALGCLFAVSPLSATAITGTANVSGNVVVTATSATFNPALTVPPGAMETGAFVGLTGATYNTTMLSGVGAVNIPDFISFSGGLTTPVLFDLTDILQGMQPQCTGSPSQSVCTPFVGGIASPFTLTQLSTGVLVGFNVTGNAYTGSSASGTSLTSGIYSTQVIVPGTITGILQQLNAPGGSINSTYSATFTATAAPTVPEPGSLLLLGMGLLGVGMFSRRRGAKS
ncbi:MAG TPA: PEP-CTERM sorting domain-containing protein [Bryobacteraceae bacterium]